MVFDHVIVNVRSFRADLGTTLRDSPFLTPQGRLALSAKVVP